MRAQDIGPGSVKMVKLLLDAGADVNVLAHNKVTALYVAAEVHFDC